MIEKEVKKAVAILKSGGTILYPTDTIWGIGCDATRRESVRQVYRIKQRADSKSMLVLVNGISMLEAYLENIPPGAMEIIEKAEKPTTIIYPGAQNLAENLLAPDGSIGIRICYDPFCRQLIDAAGIPIVSTSANFSGRDAPATFHEIDHSLRKQVDYVVNWRQEEQTATSPSSIIKLDDEGIVTVLRP